MAKSLISVNLQKKLRSAAKILETDPSFVSFPEFNNLSSTDAIIQNCIWPKLESIGIYNDDESDSLLTDSDFNDSDLLDALTKSFGSDSPAIKIVRARRIVSILRGQDGPMEVAADKEILTTEAIIDHIKNTRPYGQWKDDELITEYGQDCDSEIVNILIKRSGGRPFVVYIDEEVGVIDVEETVKILKIARHRETPDMFRVNGKMVRLYRAGDFPTLIYNECPIHNGILLFEGYCDKCGNIWDNVGDEGRHFVRVLADSDEELPSDAIGRKQLIELAEEGIEKLGEVYPRVKMEFDDLKKEDNLPSLKSRTTTANGVSYRRDPFMPSISSKSY